MRDGDGEKETETETREKRQETRRPDTGYGNQWDGQCTVDNNTTRYRSVSGYRVGLRAAT